MTQNIVIIGTGLAGYMLAKEYRKLSGENNLIMITQDDGAFYSKPLLSTALTQQKTPEQLVVNSAAEMTAQLQATIHTYSTVQSIDTDAKTVHFSDEKGVEQTIRYDHLVFAIGAKKIAIPLSGDAVDEVVSVNSLQDYGQFRSQLANKKRVVILGAGFVGCEFANDLHHADHDVTIIAPDEYPLMKLVPAKVGNFLKSTFSRAGIQWRLSRFAKAVNRSETGFAVELSGGTTVEADIVLSAVGIRPNTELAAQANIATDMGILTNDQLQTNHPDVYALGDCAVIAGELRMYVSPILHSAKVLARTIAGQSAQLTLPHLPIVIKTPLAPVSLVPKPSDVAGDWAIEETESGVRALYYDDQASLKGFALVGDCAKERMQWIKKMGEQR